MALAPALGAVGRFGGRLITGGAKSKTGMAATAALSVPFVAGVSAPVVREIGPGAHRDRMDEIRNLMTKDSPEYRLRRLQKLHEENMARLAAQNPELVTQFRAGQKLPPGSRYYGPDDPQGVEQLNALLHRMETEGL